MESVQIQGFDSQAVRANKLNLVERLADDLAHEIKNPLHSMVINLEVLKRRIARSATQSDAADLMRYVGVLSGELERVNRRVELLLRMLRPDRGGDLVSLSAVLDELVELVELERDRQGVEVDLQPGTQLLRGKVPREAARQVILNLLLVAMETAGSGGVLRVASEADAGEERLRLVASPAAGETLDAPSPGGLEESRSRLATVRALGLGFGGQLDVETRSGPEPETEFVFSISLGGA